MCACTDFSLIPIQTLLISQNKTEKLHIHVSSTVKSSLMSHDQSLSLLLSATDAPLYFLL